MALLAGWFSFFLSLWLPFGATFVIFVQTALVQVVEFLQID